MQSKKDAVQAAKRTRSYGERRAQSLTKECVGNRRDLGELHNEANNKGENRKRFGNGNTDKHCRLYLSGCFRIAADSLKRASDQNTQSNTRSYNTKADRECHAECLCNLNIHCVNDDLIKRTAPLSYAHSCVLLLRPEYADTN